MTTNKNTNETENTLTDKLLTAMLVVIYVGGFAYFCYYMANSVGKTVKRHKMEKNINAPKPAAPKNVINYIRDAYSNQL